MDRAAGCWAPAPPPQTATTDASTTHRRSEVERVEDQVAMVRPHYHGPALATA
jgi:hypothetical protein